MGMYNNEDGQLCEAEVRKNIVLAELGKPLTLPLAILNANCEFKEKWRKIQNKWHGSVDKEYRERPEVKEHNKKYNKEYRERPEVREKRNKYNREYRERPEVKEHNKEYNKEYRERKKIELKEYRDRYEVKEKKRIYDLKRSQRPEIKERKRIRYKNKIGKKDGK